jgi:hypothetical protein
MTASDLAPVAGKLGSIVRMLSSDREGEIVAAARALGRTLKSAGLDIHALAERIEQADGSGKISEADMRRLYAAGFAAGRAAAEKQNDPGGDFHNLDGTTTPEAMAAWCRRHSDRLGEREREFVRSISAHVVWREPTPKQAKWLRSIFLRTGGRL